MKTKLPIVFAVAVMITIIPGAALGRPITPERFVVGAGSYRYWFFEVPGSALVSGQFRVQEYDVNVFIMDEGEFENFRNGRSFQTYYAATRANAGEINLRLYSGRYVLVFDNTFWSRSDKTINSTIQLDN